MKIKIQRARPVGLPSAASSDASAGEFAKAAQVGRALVTATQVGADFYTKYKQAEARTQKAEAESKARSAMREEIAAWEEEGLSASEIESRAEAFLPSLYASLPEIDDKQTRDLTMININEMAEGFRLDVQGAVTKQKVKALELKDYETYQTNIKSATAPEDFQELRQNNDESLSAGLITTTEHESRLGEIGKMETLAQAEPFINEIRDGYFTRDIDDTTAGVAEMLARKDIPDEVKDVISKEAADMKADAERFRKAEIEAEQAAIQINIEEAKKDAEYGDLSVDQLQGQFKSGDFGDPNTKAAVTAYYEAERKLIKRIETVEMPIARVDALISGGYRVPDTQENRKAVDARWQRKLETLQPGDDVNDALAETVVEVGFFPDSVAQQMEANARISPNVDGEYTRSQIASLEAYSAAMDANPQAKTGLTGKEKSFYTLAKELYDSNIDPETALRMASQAVYSVDDTEAQVRQDWLSENGEESIEDSINEYFDSELGDVPGTLDDLEYDDMPEGYLTDYTRFFNSEYLATGDANAAKEVANRLTNQMWGMSDINGEMIPMRYAPERAFTEDYRQQIRNEFQIRPEPGQRMDGLQPGDFGYKPDDEFTYQVEEDFYGLKLIYVKDPVTGEFRTLTEYDPDEFQVIPPGGRVKGQPEYLLYYEGDVIHMQIDGEGSAVPVRWKPDPVDVDYKKIQELEKQLEELEQDAIKWEQRAEGMPDQFDNTQRETIRQFSRGRREQVRRKRQRRDALMINRATRLEDEKAQQAKAEINF